MPEEGERVFFFFFLNFLVLPGREDRVEGRLGRSELSEGPTGHDSSVRARHLWSLDHTPNFSPAPVSQR